MKKKGNGSTGTPLGVLTEITGLLAAITPEQFTVPPMKCGEGDHAVATATDDIKRLYTLRDRLIDKCSELSASARQLSMGALKDILAKGRTKAAEELKTPGTPIYEAKVKSEQIIAELERTNSFRDILDRIFWLEVGRQHHDLEDKSIVGIRSDWSLVWKEEDDDDGTRIEISLVGGNVADLAAMLGRHSR